MKVLDPGHQFELAFLDESDTDYFREDNRLTFVKREGPDYPGNVGSYPGTTIQEVLRACISRVKYLENQIPHPANSLVLFHLRSAIKNLELRAAERHDRTVEPEMLNPNYAIEDWTVCKHCLHIGCEGTCKNRGMVKRPNT